MSVMNSTFDLLVKQDVTLTIMYEQLKKKNIKENIESELPISLRYLISYAKQSRHANENIIVL